MARIRIRPLARRDILASAEYLELRAGPDIAERFLNAVMAELESLAEMPQIGSPCGFVNSESRDIRRWPVTGFERWLIFYELRNSVIEIARVLHGAQDIHAIFD